jgi:hypothetical protein
VGTVEYPYDVLLLYVLEGVLPIGHVFGAHMVGKLLSKQRSDEFLKNDFPLGIDGCVDKDVSPTP